LEITDVNGEIPASVPGLLYESANIHAAWTFLPDGSKRLSTVQTGAFK